MLKIKPQNNGNDGYGNDGYSDDSNNSDYRLANVLNKEILKSTSPKISKIIRFNNIYTDKIIKQNNLDSGYRPSIMPGKGRNKRNNR